MPLVLSPSIGRSWVIAWACLAMVACGGGGGSSQDAGLGDASRDAVADKGATGGTQGQDAAAGKGTGGGALGGTGVAGSAPGGVTGTAGAAGTAGGKGGSAGGGAGGVTATGGSATGGTAAGGAAGAGVGGLATGGVAQGGQGGNAGQGGGTTPGCGQEGTPCMVGLKYGLCAANVCTVCSDPADDTACKTAYGSGRLCIGGSCSAANCRQSADCPTGNVCKSNQCGPCTTGTDDALCGAGKLCLAQQCVTANCRTNTDCSGGNLCVGNTCQACTGTGDDGACTTRYGAGQICKAGACAPGCRSASACTSGKLCVNATCAGCTAGTDDAACAAVYGNTSVCSGGVCTTGACTQDASCGGGTLCQAAACTACLDTTDDTRCVARYGAGQLCVAGSCKAANCRSDAGCSSGNLCKSNSCAICVDTTDDGACAARYGAGNICKGGLCRVGCRDSTVCATGQLCGATFMCGGCQDPADDAACASAHGAGTICAQGSCASGCRLDTQCSQGSLCKGEACGACINVTDDGACATRYGAGTICNGGQCVAGCRSPQACVGADAGKLCTALACTACAQSPSGDSDCTAAYALQSVCAGGACVPGNCRTSSDCGGSNAGYRCVGNQCTPCANDPGCQGDTAYGAGFICHTAATDASGSKGQCVSNNCTTARATCSANPSVDYCCSATGGNKCITGNCCVTGDCAFGQICTNHQCNQCNTVTDGNYYVDPVNGSDSAGVTGSTTCAWKTVTYALSALAASSAAATINIKATGDVGTSSGETLPLGVSTVLPNAGGTLRIVPANRTIRGAGSDVPTIKLAANQVAFYLAAPNSHLTQLVIDSIDSTQANRGSYGIRAFQGTAITTSIDHVTVRNTQGAGIRVERSTTAQTTSGILTIGPGVTVTAAGTAACGGLHVLATGAAHITGGTGSDVTQFINNNGYGICVAERGQIDILGTPVYPVPSGAAEGTVVIKGNTSGGISVAQCIADPALYAPINGGPVPPPGFTQGNCAATLPGLSGPPPLNTLNGVAIWSHGTGTANGLYITAGSSVRLRNSVILGSARAGVRVDNGPTYTSGANNYRVFDLSAVDLGTANDAGGNLLQIPWGANAPLNGGAGVQVNITAAQGQTLVARGNKFQDDATSSMSLDCRTSTAAISRNYPITTCFTVSTKGISVCGNLAAATNANQLDVATCKVP